MELLLLAGASDEPWYLGKNNTEDKTEEILAKNRFFRFFCLTKLVYSVQTFLLLIGKLSVLERVI